MNQLMLIDCLLSPHLFFYDFFRLFKHPCVAHVDRGSIKSAVVELFGVSQMRALLIESKSAGLLLKMAVFRRKNATGIVAVVGA